MPGGPLTVTAEEGGFAQQTTDVNAWELPGRAVALSNTVVLSGDDSEHSDTGTSVAQAARRHRCVRLGGLDGSIGRVPTRGRTPTK